MRFVEVPSNISRFSDMAFLQLHARFNDFKIQNIFLGAKIILVANKPIEGAT